MISLEAVQASIISLMKADAALVNRVGSEIREDQWQGTEFSYPATRVELESGLHYTRDQCRNTHSRVRFRVRTYSEQSSSQLADVLAGMVVSALLGNTLSGSGTDTTNPFYSGLIELAAPGQESAKQNPQNLWEARVTFEVHIHERT